ncbi:MAG: hypothetical protein ACREOK_07160 [Gemmatimonadaceae bacterium]
MTAMTVRAATLLLVAIPALIGAQQRQPGAADQRAQLEARFRQQFARVVRQRVGLSDEQMTRLGPINERFAAQRRQLQMQERSARTSLQRVLRNPALADSAEVSRLLQHLVDAQKRRVQLLEAEQRELAAIMTPLQRARYMALQEQVRRQVEQRRNRGRGGAPQSRRRPPSR